MLSYIFSCEHATCAVPEAYRDLFRDSEEVVQSHEGWEPGVLNLAQAFSIKFRTPLIHGDVTRLLINLEKEGDERWSLFSIKLPETTRVKIADRHERPFRTQLKQRIAEDLRRHAVVLHVLIHTSLEIDGRVRLETPAESPLSEAMASAWQNEMRLAEIDVLHFPNTERNPTEGFLAREFEGQSYLQLRITVAQSFFLEGRPMRWELFKKLLVETLMRSTGEIRMVSGQVDSSTPPISSSAAAPNPQ